MQTLVLVRHGATAWNENGYCQGRKDVPLSSRGREQAARTSEALAHLSFDRVFASPLDRAQETARHIRGDPEILEDLIEIDRGHWEGHEMSEVRRRWGKLCKVWYDDPTGETMPGGESFDGLWERAGRLLNRLEDCEAEWVLACGHKAVNRVLLARALDRPAKGVWQIPQPQACCSVLVREGGGWRAERIGDVSHLPDELRSDS
ncbi:MAG: histidine phosphatase family protein [Planctomycetota bacterium]|jgi:broad specificity phosphatase PhoE